MANPSQRETAARLDALEREVLLLRRELAATPTDVEPLPQGELVVVAFLVGQERVAFRVGNLDEVVRMARLVPLPEAPPWCPGVLDRKGTLVPVIDLLARLGRSERRPLPADFIALGRVAERRVGFIVQEVLGVRRLEGGLVRSAPVGLAYGPYVLGVAQLEDGAALLLSASALAAMSDLPAASDAREAAGGAPPEAE